MADCLAVGEVRASQGVARGVNGDRSGGVYVRVRGDFLLGNDLSNFQVVNFRGCLQGTRFYRHGPIKTTYEEFRLGPGVTMEYANFCCVQFMEHDFYVERVAREHRRDNLTLVVVLSVGDVTTRGVRLFKVIFVIVIAAGVERRRDKRDVLFARISRGVIEREHEATP